MCADLKSILNRPLDNDGNILLHFEKEACGILYASQFSAGEENNLRIRVYGTRVPWSGIRKSRTTCGSGPMKGRRNSTAEETTICAMPPSEQPACRRDIRKPLLKHLPMSMPTQPMRFVLKSSAKNRTNWYWISPR